ncbi:MAG: RluA family pseudouridine synthase [Clostridia bacterium]|nr:RluA family pseudouridine synthase [Clostridia bacterium]
MSAFEEKNYICTKAEAGLRADAGIAALCQMSRNALVKLIEEERVFVNGSVPNKKSLLSEGDSIRLLLSEVRDDRARPEDIPLDIVYEDDDIIVINKPSGMVVHPAAGHEEGTLVNALLHHCGDSLSGIGGVKRPGIVHRIDKETSGLLVAAKNDFAHQALSNDLKVHAVSRTYTALVIGHLKERSGTIDAPIGRNPADRKKMAVIEDGIHKARNAVTHYNVISSLNDFDLVSCRLETGRTHQIRVHMAYLGHPILGDPLYGGAKHPFVKAHKAIFEGQCLHAECLELTHPRTGEKMKFQCPLPPSFKRILDLLLKVD